MVFTNYKVSEICLQFEDNIFTLIFQSWVAGRVWSRLIVWDIYRSATCQSSQPTLTSTIRNNSSIPSPEILLTWCEGRTVIMFKWYDPGAKSFFILTHLISPTQEIGQVLFLYYSKSAFMIIGGIFRHIHPQYISIICIYIY